MEQLELLHLADERIKFIITLKTLYVYLPYIQEKRKCTTQRLVHESSQ